MLGADALCVAQETPKFINRWVEPHLGFAGLVDCPREALLRSMSPDSAGSGIAKRLRIIWRANQALRFFWACWR